MIAALAILLAVAVFSPILALKTITIDGITRVQETDVQAAVESQLGTPLALLDYDAIRDDLATFPLIRSYVTEVVPPNTLRIHIVEREPIAAVTNGSSFDLVDPAGVVVASTSDRSGIPLVDPGVDGIGGKGFTTAVEVLLAMPDSVTTRIDTITARTADDVGLTLRDSTLRVVWGDAEDSELKAKDLERLLALPDCTALPVIDVSAPLAPICGPN